MRQILNRLRYANVMSTLALVIALGGTSYAAVKLPKNSVGTIQVKTHAITPGDLAASAVTTSKVRNGSLRREDFKAGELPSASDARGDAGVAGAAGPAGPAGPTGPTGPAGTAAIGTTPVAFADFAETGKQRVNTQASGLTFPAHEPTHTPGSGVYCFAREKLPFAPKIAMVTADNVGNVNDTVVSAFAFSNPEASPGCDVRVRTANGKGALVDRAFSILLLG